MSNLRVRALAALAFLLVAVLGAFAVATWRSTPPDSESAGAPAATTPFAAAAPIVVASAPTSTPGPGAVDATAEAAQSSTPSASPTAEASQVSAPTATPQPVATATAPPVGPAAPRATLSSTPNPTPTARTRSTPTPTPQPSVTRPARLLIPRFGVDAQVLTLGVDAAGEMEVPRTASQVAWYNFSALPGRPGNAVMAAHVDYGGVLAVFYNLVNLRTSDVISVIAGGKTLSYSVQQVYSVPSDHADLNGIIGAREGPETLTLITCGGTFDRSVRAYDRRVIVVAHRVG